MYVILVEGMFFVNQKWRKTRRRSTTRLLELTEICDSSNSAATGICHFKNIAIWNLSKVRSSKAAGKNTESKALLSKLERRDQDFSAIVLHLIFLDTQNTNHFEFCCLSICSPFSASTLNQKTVIEQISILVRSRILQVPKWYISFYSTRSSWSYLHSIVTKYHELIRTRRLIMARE
jgi:hypothetical protein